MADTDVNEEKQIGTSLFYLEKKVAEPENRKKDLKLFERDLAELRKKLLERLNQLNC